jgi:hypothetical protein
MQREMKDILCNDLGHILAYILEKMKQEQGHKFHLDCIPYLQHLPRYRDGRPAYCGT